MFSAFFRSLKQEFAGYNSKKLLADMMAGLTVCAVALPLALAFGVSSGASAASGLVTAIIAGVVIAILGGASYQISGPTGAMSAVLVGIVAEYGLQGVFFACFAAGVLLLLAGVFKLGRLISFIPMPVIMGFTSGIATIIAMGQIDNFFGTVSEGGSNLEKIASYGRLGFHPNMQAVLIGLLVVLVMVFWPKKWGARVPGSLVGIILATIVATVAGMDQLAVVGDIPKTLLLADRLSLGGLSFTMLENLISPIVTIAALGMIESLLCGASASRMKGEAFNADQELIAQGVGNILLPLFGAISDKSRSRMGRRMPFILCGTGCAVLLMMLLPILDNSYAASPSVTKLVLFIAVLGLLLVAMGTYRSPAVALMPDVTPKPLRSRANAIINLMGAVGGILYLGVAAVLYPNSKTAGLDHVNYQPLFIVVSAIMFIAIAILFLTVKEPKLTAENQALEKQHPEWNLAQDDGSGHETLPKPVKKSLGFLLASIALWFIGYNGVTTWFSTYVDVVMGQGLGGASTCLLIATAGAIVSYIPIGQIASKIGRRRTIQGGIVLLTICFALGYVLTTAFSSINAIMFIVFALVGLAWAAINVNSLPMVVEMCKGSDIGKFTGYYYTASMAAQVVTPVVAGTLMRKIDYRALFPYAALFVALSFVTMLFVRHGDVKAEAKKGLDAFEDMDD